MKLVTLQPVEGAQKRVDIKVGKTIIGRGPLLEVSAGSYRGARASSTPPEAESSLGETDKNRALETPSTPPPLPVRHSSPISVCCAIVLYACTTTSTANTYTTFYWFAAGRVCVSFFRDVRNGPP